MPKCHVIQFSSDGITDQSCYTSYFAFLSTEATVVKLYLDYEKGFGKAYFKTKSEAIAVQGKLRADPRFEVTDELAVEDLRPKGQSKQKSPKMSSDELEVVEEVVYDAFGNSLPVFVNDEGDSYIPRSDLEKSGFKLYDDPNELPVRNEKDRQSMIEYLKTQGEFFFYKHFNRLPDQCDVLLHQAIMATISRTSFNAEPQETTQKDQSNSFGNNNRKLSSSSRTSFDNNKNTPKTYESQDRFNRSNERNNQTPRPQPQRYSGGSERSFGSAEKPRPLSAASQRKDETSTFNRKSEQISFNGPDLNRSTDKMLNRKSEQVNGPELNRSTDKMNGNLAAGRDKVVEVPKPQTDRPPQLRKPVTAQKVAEAPAPKRSNIVDKLSGTSGFLQCCQVNDDGTFVASLIPSLYGTQIETLSELQSYALEQPIDSANVGDVVGVKFSWCGEDSVARAAVVDHDGGGEYTVAILDYGQILKRRELYRLKKDDADILDFAVTCAASSGFLPKNEELYEYTSLQGDKILIEKKHEVSCSSWYDSVNCVKKTTDVPKTTDVQKVIKEQPKTDDLKIGDQCMIVNEENGSLKIRTRTGFALVKSLISSLQEHKATKLTSRPEVDQLVLCDNNGTLARAMVAEITGDVARLHLIDTGETCLTPVNSLFYIDGFHETPGTLHAVKLKHFEDKTFSGLVRSYLKTIYKREKFRIVSVSGDVVELENSTGTSLGGKLRNMDKPPYKTVKDLPAIELKVGEKKEYPIAYVQAEDGVISLLPDADALMEVTELLEGLPVNETLPLNMHVGELCLSKYDDLWSRAYISKIDNVGKKYEVCYIDFGNFDTVPQDSVREYPTQLLKYPAMAVKCRIEDVVTKFGTPLPPNVANVLNSLSEISYVTVHVLSKAADCYNISVPIVVQAME